MVATTSSAVMVAPLWNLTPLRILKVQTLPSWLGVQLSASTGRRTRSEPEFARNSPVCCSISRPPASATVMGSMAAAGTVVETRKVADEAARAAAGREDRAEGAQHGAGGGQRHAGDAGVTQEGPAVDISRHELVDDVVLPLAGSPPDGVEQLVPIAHDVSLLCTARVIGGTIFA